MPIFNPDRRKFLKITSTALGSSLIIGMSWSCSSENGNHESESGLNFSPNAWLRVSTSNDITVIVAESEMGQGPYTLMPMMIAEELEVDWASIKVERASVDPVYGYQMTGGSSSIRKGWSTLRQAGAIAREILILAAADKFQVSPSECLAMNGHINHVDSEKKFSYGELVDAAMNIPLPEQVRLKNPSEFRIIGHSVPRKDIPEKVNGAAIFGIDIDLPEQIYATVVHSPVFGASPKQVKKDKALALNGAIDVFEIAEGVALVASNTWSAFKMAQNIEIEWNTSPKSEVNTQSIQEKIIHADQVPDKTIESLRDPDIFKNSDKAIQSQYLQPFQAHMTMEPMNCTAHFKPDGELEIWAPTQSPSAAWSTARSLTQSKLERGVKKLGYKLSGGYDDSVNVNTTLLGGGFGRRLQQDYVSEVVQIAEHFEQPVQLVWPRNEDVQHDYYHPMSYHEMKAVLDKQGMPVAWEHKIKGSDISSGGAEHLYQIPNQRIQVYDLEKIIPTGPWRSVAAHYNVFAVEHFMDELAFKGGHDPLDYRLTLLRQSPRLLHVLELVADNIHWNGSVNGAISYGVAAAYTFGSYVAQILELEKTSTSTFRVNKVVCAIDCGIVINPNIVKQQMEGSIIFGLSAATKSQITINNGRVEQSNFHDYPILRMDETPDIEVLIVKNEENPQGIGEPGVPPVAPALANALYAQTGLVTRELPIKLG